jgi:hypothetical protein
MHQQSERNFYESTQPVIFLDGANIPETRSAFITRRLITMLWLTVNFLLHNRPA